MSRPRSLAAALAAMLLAGCTTFTGFGNRPASRLHALDLSAAPAQRAPCAVRFAVRDVRLAGHLERPELVVARNGSRIVADPADLWAAPLAQQLRRELAGALAARLEGSQPVAHPWRLDEAPQLAVALDVDRLEATGRMLRASVGWRLVQVADGRQLGWGRWDNERELVVAPALAREAAAAREAPTVREAGPLPAADGAAAGAVITTMNATLAAMADALAARIAAAGGRCAAR